MLIIGITTKAVLIKEITDTIINKQPKSWANLLSLISFLFLGLLSFDVIEKLQITNPKIKLNNETKKAIKKMINKNGTEISHFKYLSKTRKTEYTKSKIGKIVFALL